MLYISKTLRRYWCIQKHTTGKITFRKFACNSSIRDLTYIPVTSTVGDIFQKEDDKYLCLNIKWNVNPERDSIEEIALKPTSFAISISVGPISLSLDLKSAPMLGGPGWVKCTKISPHCYSAPPETRVTGNPK